MREVSGHVRAVFTWDRGYDLSNLAMPADWAVYRHKAGTGMGTDKSRGMGMSRHDTEKLMSLLIVLAVVWATYVCLETVYKAVNEPDEPRMCVSESGHKEVPCPD